MHYVLSRSLAQRLLLRPQSRSRAASAVTGASTAGRLQSPHPQILVKSQNN